MTRKERAAQVADALGPPVMHRSLDAGYLVTVCGLSRHLGGVPRMSTGHAWEADVRVVAGRWVRCQACIAALSARSKGVTNQMSLESDEVAEALDPSPALHFSLDKYETALCGATEDMDIHSSAGPAWFDPTVEQRRCSLCAHQVGLRGVTASWNRDDLLLQGSSGWPAK